MILSTLVAVLIGTYQLQPQPFVVQKILHESVPIQSASGRQHRDALLGQGYLCESTPLKIDRCTRRAEDRDLTPTMLQKIQEKYADRKILKFGAPLGLTELVHQSPAYNEWKTPQAVEYGGRHFEETFAFEGTTGIHKVRLGSESSGVEFHLDPEASGELARVVAESEGRGDWKRWTEYQLLLIYLKETHDGDTWTQR